MFQTSSNSVAFHIGLRYTRAKQRNGFISFVSIFALVGMALGVFALIVVLSVMNGFDRELKQRLLRVVPHGNLSTHSPLIDWKSLYARIGDTQGLIAAAPFIEGKGLLAAGSVVKPIQIQGVNPKYEKNISAVHDHMIAGELAFIQPGQYGIVMGDLLAAHLGLRVGDKVSLTLPEVSVTPAGIFPRSKRFKLVGIFSVGAPVDQYLVLIHINDAQ